MTKDKAQIEAALNGARKLVSRWLEVEITSNATIEREARPGSIQDGEFYFNPDTVKDVHAAQSIQQHQRVIRQIDAALR